MLQWLHRQSWLKKIAASVLQTLLSVRLSDLVAPGLRSIATVLQPLLHPHSSELHEAGWAISTSTKKLDSHYWWWFSPQHTLCRMIPPCMGEYVSRLSHQIDYSLLISISLAQKVLANDLNLHFFKRTRALTKGSIHWLEITLFHDLAFPPTGVFL